MLDRLDPQPADPLLSVIGLFAADPRVDKIDLGVGVYRNEARLTPVMKAVKAAELRLLADQPTKAYVGPSGDLEFLDRLRILQFGGSSDVDRIIGLQTPGGTGALRAAADLLVRAGIRAIWVGRPSWANHDPILAAAGLSVRDYAYFDPASQRVDFERLTAALEDAERGDAVLLQAACHNPTGADPSPEQWREIARLVSQRGLVPLIDVAYQGLGADLDADMSGAKAVIASCEEALVAVSCSKNFGLYRERTGGLFVFAAGPKSRSAIESNMLAIARANYSMPPDHGAAIVRTILSDSGLDGDWRSELSAMRARIQGIRMQLARIGRVGPLDLAALRFHRGMFSLLPLTPAQIQALRTEHGIYMTGSGRVNLAGLNVGEIDAFVTALTEVLDGQGKRPAGVHSPFFRPTGHLVRST
jgi:aromatic-amino-acid transaminase